MNEWLIVVMMFSVQRVEPADEHVEGGIYISPEFQLGQVYDGAADVVEDVILYRPVYVCAPRPPGSDIGNGHSPSVRGVDHTPSPSPVQGSPARPRAGGGAGGGVSPAGSTEQVSRCDCLLTNCD